MPVRTSGREECASSRMVKLPVQNALIIFDAIKGTPVLILLIKTVIRIYKMKSINKMIIVLSVLLSIAQGKLFDDPDRLYLTDFINAENEQPYIPQNKLLKKPEKALQIEQAFIDNSELPNLEFDILDADTSNQIIVEGKLNSKSVSIIIKPYHESLLGEEVDLSEATWENRMEICAASDNCKISMVNARILNHVGANVTVPVLYSGVFELNGDQGEVEKYCVTVRSRHRTLEEYIAAIKPEDDFSQLKMIIAELAQVLAIMESLNIVSGNLSTTNIDLVGNFEQTEFHPKISDTSSLKFVSFSENDYYTGLSYETDYRAPEVNNEQVNEVYKSYDFLDETDDIQEEAQVKIQIDEQPNSARSYGRQSSARSYGQPRGNKIDSLYDSYISTNGNPDELDLGPYVYSLKEDAYAFGMLLRNIGKDLSNITKDKQSDKIDFLRALEVMYKKLTHKKRFLRPSMAEVQLILSNQAEIPTNIYKEFIGKKQEIVQETGDARLNGQQRMMDAEDNKDDLTYSMLNAKF